MGFLEFGWVWCLILFAFARCWYLVISVTLGVVGWYFTPVLVVWIGVFVVILFSCYFEFVLGFILGWVLALGYFGFS